MPPAPASRLRRLAVAAAVAVLAIGLGTWIGTQIGHKRAEDRAKRAQRAADRQRATAAAEDRRERKAEALDDALEDANDELLRLAKAGGRDAVARQEAKLTQLNRRQDTTDEGTDQTPRDPYERELDRFPIKRAPLFAQQITSSDDDHVLFVSVFESHFCLKSHGQRRQAIRDTYTPIADRLRRAKIDDFEMLAVPFDNNVPTRSQALASGSGRRVSLTRRGQSC